MQKAPLLGRGVAVALIGVITAVAASADIVLDDQYRIAHADPATGGGTSTSAGGFSAYASGLSWARQTSFIGPREISGTARAFATSQIDDDTSATSTLRAWFHVDYDQLWRLSGEIEFLDGFPEIRLREDGVTIRSWDVASERSVVFDTEVELVEGSDYFLEARASLSRYVPSAAWEFDFVYLPEPSARVLQVASLVALAALRRTRIRA